MKRDWRQQCGASPRGFTLIEVLLALLIVAAIMAVVGPTMLAALRAQREAYTTLEPMAQRQVMLDCLRDDLLSAPRPIGSVAQPLTVTPSEIAGEHADGLSCFTLGALALHYRVAQRPAVVGQQVVTWTARLAEPTDADRAAGLPTESTGIEIVRSSNPHLLATGTAPEPTEEIMMTGLGQFTIEAWADGAWTRAFTSADTDGTLPQMIRITTAVRRADGSSGDTQVAVIALTQRSLDPTQLEDAP